MADDNLILLKGVQIYSENEFIKKGFIKIKNNKIVEFGPLDQLIHEEDFNVVDVPSTYAAVPGFIDVHIHGADGADTMDATEAALKTMANALPKEGTTSFLATTITQDVEQIENAIINAGEYIHLQPSQGIAEILGIHLEGPFVNRERAGAQPLQHIIEPDLALFKRWQTLSNGMIKLVTLAPELPNGLDMIRYLNEQGIVSSIGHSDATYEIVTDAMKAGASHVTHLFNQMRGLHHREPGVVGATLLHDELKAEMIVDGIHVRPEMVHLAYKQKKSDGLILITDSMRAKCLKNGTYDLGGQEVNVEDGTAVLSDGTLAGSVLKLGHAVKNIIHYTGCSLKEAVKMASENPAKQLNIFERKGSIAVGKDADIVILDEHYDVQMTFCRGKLAYKKGGNEG
ncbi:N-acetylglucosamine-6-phosphate deacetylase [Bacillus sp. 7586-K]|uniref:N-acetylglucosamine-6-phosphate deacetylase n=1 Tax=Metabacillus niabensis TaxID=324854 RepID=A0ABT9Z0Y9_9BACI|nr:N-acetylglucosamine-6-phosphate deacetylase [Metabacillus niabensis]MDQ0225926.1 N-acetylglucosamine-6-phosphate deacetylase [Metabacillus niabensis]PAD68669.1 N-acetylglucosamine-6-phosphate deacetylase [Bacillus sp. 7586-K]